MSMVIKLQAEHEKLFYSFLDEAISLRPDVANDRLWQNTPFILDSREIFAYIENDKILMTVAIRYTPQMPWVIMDTFINLPMDLKKSYKVTSALLNELNSYTQSKGIYSYWLLRNERLERTMTGGTRNTQDYRNLTSHGVALARIMKDYNVATRAVIKAGTMPGVPLYDFMLDYKPLDYDCIIRELSLKQSTFEDKNLKDYFTYG